MQPIDDEATDAPRQLVTLESADVIAAGEAAREQQKQAEDDWLAGQLSHETQRAYRLDIRQFLAWLQAEKGVTMLGQIRSRDISDWRRSLREHGYATSSIARKLSSVRQLFAHALAEGLVLTNPAAVVKGYHVSQVSPRHALENAQARALLEGCNRASKKGARDHAILSLLLYLGLRRSEVARITLGDFASERGHITLRILGKREKVRLLPVPVRVMESVRNYLRLDDRLDALPVSVGGKGEADPETPLWRRTKTNHHRAGAAQPVHSNTIYRLVKLSAARAGITSDVHTLRHTAITNALDGGATLRRAQAMAGHSSPDTTSRYDSRREDLDDSAVHRVSYS